jgi:hypothetical protein
MAFTRKEDIVRETVVFNGHTYHRYPESSRRSHRKYFMRVGGRKLLHRAVWEHYNGPIPAKHHVHHIDHDTGNNAIENLELVSAAEHFAQHAEDRKGKCSTAMREHLASIRDKAAAWHSSADGRRWHSEVSSKNFRAGGAGYLARAAAWENRKKNPYQFVCEMCKTPFTALVRTARFCSQTCVRRNYRANKRKAESI